MPGKPSRNCRNTPKPEESVTAMFTFPSTLIGKVGALIQYFGPLAGSCSTFTATLLTPLASKEREQAGTTGHHHTHLALLLRSEAGRALLHGLFHMEPFGYNKQNRDCIEKTRGSLGSPGTARIIWDRRGW